MLQEETCREAIEKVREEYKSLDEAKANSIQANVGALVDSQLQRTCPDWNAFFSVWICDVSG
jgi:hypothetical protein